MGFNLFAFKKCIMCLPGTVVVGLDIVVGAETKDIRKICIRDLRVSIILE